MMRRKRLWLAVLALAALVAASPAQAAPRSAGGLDRAWAWLAAMLPWTPQISAAVCDWGSHIDPNGGCRAAAQPMQAAPAAACWGPYIDPDGSCRAGAAQSSPDWGPEIDPNG